MSSHIKTGHSPLEVLQALPRRRLAFLPTPLHRAPALSQRLGIDLWLKRDDLTGLALGGNKARKLELLIAGAEARGADTIITTGGSQSNHARMAAAACRLAALDCHLVLDRGRHPENGNLLLDQLLGASVELINDPDQALAGPRMAEVASELEARGRRPYVIPRGGSVPLGAAGYVRMVVELVDQLAAHGAAVDSVYVPTGSCGTHAGILAGRSIAGQDWTVHGISVSRARNVQEERVFTLANEVLALLEADPCVRRDDAHVDDGYAGSSYGSPTPATWAALGLTAELEGVILDPVYTGKAMAGLLDHVRRGMVEAGSRVVFVHTGGAPALFGYADEVPGGAGRDAHA